MATLAAAFPELSDAVVQALRNMGHTDLAAKYPDASIRRVTFDNAADAAYIYLADPESQHGATIPLDLPEWFLVLDTAADGQPQGVEWLSPPGRFKAQLRAMARP
jgi:uncharacterized protein YuzE